MYKKRLVLAVILLLVPVFSLFGMTGSCLSEPITNNEDLKKPDSNHIGQSSSEPFIHGVYSSNLPTYTAPVIDKNDTVYFSTENDLIAVDAKGSKIWSWHCNDKLNSPKIDPDGVLYITSDKGMLYAINATGKELWHYQAASSNAQYLIFSCTSCTVAKDGSIYFMILSKKNSGNGQSKDCEGMLFAINRSGTLRWSVNTNKNSVFSGIPAVNDSGTVFIQYVSSNSVYDRLFKAVVTGYTYNTIIDAYGPMGNMLWEQAFSSNLDSGLTSLFINGNNGVIFGLDYKLCTVDSTGKKDYYESKDRFTYGNGIGLTSDQFFVITSGSNLSYLNPDFSVKWKLAANSSINCAPLIGRDGLIYISTEKGTLYCYDQKGTLKWEENLTGNVASSSLAYCSCGMICQLTRNGDLNTVGRIKTSSFSLNTNEITLLQRGMKGILRSFAYINSTMKNVKWSSDNIKVATVEDGIITPVSQGTTVIRALCGNGTVLDTCKVTVTSQPAPDITMSCDIILTGNGYSNEGIYTFQNLTLQNGVIVTNDSTSTIELIIKGTMQIGKYASIRIRNGYFPNAPDSKISSLTSESLHKIAVIKNDAILHFPGIFGKGGNGGNGGNGTFDSYLTVLKLNQYDNNIATSSGGGGGAGGYGGGLGGSGGRGSKNYTLKETGKPNNETNPNDFVNGKYPHIETPSATINEEAGKASAGDSNGGNGGSVNDTRLFSKNAAIALSGGKGGAADGIGEGGGCGESRTSGGSGGGGNSGNGGENGEKLTGSNLNLLNNDAYHNGAGGGGGGGGGYGGGMLVIVAGSIDVQISDFPCFVVAGQKGGKGGYPNGQDGENGEGGMLVIETNSYKPLLSHWNVGGSTLECNNSSGNGGHGTVTGNPQKVFINGIDVSNYTDNSIKTFDSSKRSVALIKNIVK